MKQLESLFEELEQRILKYEGQRMKHLESLLEELEQRIPEFARMLKAPPRGVAGAQLLRFAGGIASDDLALMQDAIEKGCEQVRLDEW
ncbi:MAG: hypothetical protein GXP25_25380 [Planctomycetes bacterium]|nr:hypothetical protein [Planctomycetota bacterium]